MKNDRINMGSFATAKLQAKMRSIFAIIAFVAVIGFLTLPLTVCRWVDVTSGGDDGTGGTGGTGGGGGPI